MTRITPKWKVTLYWRELRSGINRESVREYSAWTPAGAIAHGMAEYPYDVSTNQAEIRKSVYRVDADLIVAR